MATVAVAQETRQGLASRIDVLTGEVQTLEGKLHDEKTKLAAFVAQRPELARRIAMDEEKSSTGRELAISIAEVEMRIEGLTTLVAEKRGALSTVESELRQAQAEEAHRTRLARLEQLKADGTSLAKSINEQHVAVQARIGELDALCQTLRREFVDAGGQLHAAPIDDLAVTATALLATLNQQIASVRPRR